ncbi:error-prone DNA polymerase [Ferribacterium limneticum]|uniref:error-prone DNA polymerase n=1 Tax=Ferribacterium limneticum TaxID=76259 RepID=UPI001CFA25A2|nr:error-prone DNA polymerase [Ferribacterium limneticum]UCV30080.1 error-prone DNA polymerase [Ferribacterium limneticum]UCV33999.1 error-prone DNA polymerase [Ferribacterium limneticum]
MSLPDYAELHCLSNFSFLRGASHPEELAERAVAQGYSALALTDECSLAGVVRAHLAARKNGLKFIVGSEITMVDGLKLVFLACNRHGYGNLSALITLARRRAGKGSYTLHRNDLEAVSPSGALPDCLVLWVPGGNPSPEDGEWLASRFPGRCWIAVELHAGPDDLARLASLQALGEACGLPLVATGDVHMHIKARRPVQDVLTALRLKSTVFEAGYALFPNGERHLRSRLRLSRLYPPELLAETLSIAARCEFSLDELRYEYPEEIVPAGETPASWLRAETERGLQRRYPAGVPDSVRERIEHELGLITEMAYEAYFLTVYDIVCFARSQDILCQGRGSAANSAVCYALGVTEVDPARSALLFERFVSKERGEPPDIDVDFEHERREEVIQYIYAKYGRERAALAAALITYRTKGALRDAGRALGFGIAQINALTASLAWWDKREKLPERFAELGLDPQVPRVEKWLAIAEALRGFPRHLTQHVGGFVISRGPLSRLVPVENAAMPARSVIQWDKDDLDAMGLMKVDILALGMLSAIRRMLQLVGETTGRALKMQDIPPEDPATYAMLCKADSMGVFQVESRAQMAMLPRLRPRSFYDLVVEVALVRPGPIQGDMVHPYLKRRQGRERIERISPAVDAVLERTYGVPIFQEQVMQLAVVAANFTPGEADQLRRAMAAWKRKGGLEPFEQKLRAGMADNRLPAAFAERIILQIQGFGEYGFPESHAASFALLVYASAWLKRHHPAAFLCGLLNSQPMGFYSPSMLIQDARRHGVSVLPPDVMVSNWDSHLDENGAVRLGLREISGFSKAVAERIAAVYRKEQPFSNVADLAERAGLQRRDLDLLAAADALQGLAGHRRQAAWAASAAVVQGDLFDGTPVFETEIELPAPNEGENLVADYRSLGLTLRCHPLTLLRQQLAERRFVSATDLKKAGHHALIRSAGIVVGRQRPGTATGIVFVTLEDESGLTNVVVHPQLVEKQRRELLNATLLGVYGQLQVEGEVLHLVAKRLVDLSAWLGRLETVSRDFH